MSTTASQSDAWIRRYHPAPELPYRLVCLPHAGGSASFFFPFSAALSATADVVAVQYPGRQDRRSEPLLESVPEIVDAVYEALRPWADRPLAFFGHSMGAVLSFELLRRFEREGGAKILGLVASGRRSPTVYREETVHLKGEDAVVAEMRALSGTDAGVLADEELLRMVMPAIRADYKAIETYRYEPDTAGPPLSCPISVLTGESDPRVNLEDAKEWQTLTTGDFTFRSYPGGHFYLTPQQKAVIAAVKEDLESFAG